MAQLGLQEISKLISQHNNALLQQQHSQTTCPVEITDGPQAGLQVTLQQSRQEPIVRSPTSTVAEYETSLKLDAAALAAAYRARIALAAASPAPSAAPANQPRGTPAARLLTFINSPLPTPTVHGTDQNGVHVLEKKWKTLYGSLRSNSQAAADVLMKQAQATAGLEELAQALFIQLKAGAEERSRLQQLLLQERSQLMAHAEEAQHLQQRLHKSEHLSTAVQVVTESLQGQLAQAREALEASNQERRELADQVKQLAQQLAVVTECRTRGDALIADQTSVIETLRQQVEEQASALSTLADDKAQLEAQLQGVLRAEQELTVHLRETHAAIEGQLGALRDQLKAERQKRATVVKRRGELQAQVEQLQTQLAAQQADMAALTDRLGRGHASQPASSSRGVPAAAAGHGTAPSAPKPSSAGGVLPRASSAGGAVHAAHSHVPAGASSQPASASAAAHQRARSLLRSSTSVPSNPRPATHSPTASAGGSAGRPAAQRRTSSPTGLENTSGGSNAAAVTFHVPSMLASPEASFAGTQVPASAPGSAEGAPPSHEATPVAAHTRLRATAGIEPPSPPIALAPMSARENTGPQTDLGSVGANRRRSPSPEASARASANAAQHARRVTSAAARPAAGRAASPSPATGSTWLP